LIDGLVCLLLLLSPTLPMLILYYGSCIVELYFISTTHAVFGKKNH